MKIEYIRTKKMDTKKKTLQCLFCQNTFSRKDNLLRHLKMYHNESIPSRMPPKKAKRSKPCSSEFASVLHSFYNDRFRSNNVWEDRTGKKTVKT